MKKILFTILITGIAGMLVSATAQDSPGNHPPGPPPGMGSGRPDAPGRPGSERTQSTNASATTNHAATTNAVTAGEPTPVKVPAKFLPPGRPLGTNNPDALRMNFRNAPLNMVLNYLSDAAGFIIVMDTQVNGNVNVISDHPMTRDEAVNLLNQVLNQNGYAAIRSGRTLTIVSKSQAKTSNIPVYTGNDPSKVPDTAEIVTQIIPIRFVDAQQLASDLTSFASPQATVVANQAGNAIVITDTQSNIKHLMEIIEAVDNSAEAETEIRVFRLKYADPTDVANELGQIFPNNNSGTQNPVRFGGRGGFFRRMMARAERNNNNSSNSRIQKATQVTAVADSRIQAVIVSAPKDLMEQIASMMTSLDVPSSRDQHVYVFHMNNGDPEATAQVLQNMFQSTTSSRGSANRVTQNSALMQRAQNNATSSGSASTTTSGFSNTGNRRTGNTGF